MTTTLIKQPSEEKIYAVDFSDLLATGDSIASITSVTDTPTGDLTITAEAISGDTVQFMVADGDDGTTYLITVIVATTDGEVLEGDGYLEVVNLPTTVDNLTLAYSDLLADLGQWLGWGRSGWTADQEATLIVLLKAGLQQFYWPPSVERSGAAHSWSFLKPVATLATVIGQADYDLPSDFGGLIGSIYYSASDDIWHPITDKGPGYILSLRSRDLSNGPPSCCAILPKTSTGVNQQMWTLAISPAADAVYTLTYRFAVNPTYIDASHPYHKGAAVHSQTLLQSCLAVAELRFRDGEQAMQAAFLRALAASVAHDRKMSPQNLGYNGDKSGFRPTQQRRSYVTYNGTLYDGS